MAVNSIFASCRCMVSGATPSSVMVLLLSVYNLSKSLIVVQTLWMVQNCRIGLVLGRD